MHFFATDCHLMLFLIMSNVQRDQTHGVAITEKMTIRIRTHYLTLLQLEDRLSLDSLLERCVDSFTQNAAESLYSVLWNLCPKRPFVGSTTANLCAGLAVIIYNDGHQAT